MTQSLPVSRLIRVDVDLAPIAAQSQDLSDLLILGSSDVIDVTERIRTYESIDAVAADFGTTAPEYLAAVLWFEQSPQPTQLKIGRWAEEDTNGLLNCGGLSAAQEDLDPWNLITPGAFFVYLNGIPHAISGMNFSAATSLNGIAALIQTPLDAALDGTTCVWDALNNRFVIASGTAGVGSSVSFLEAPTAVGDIVFGGNPANDTTITLNGTVVTFKTGTPSGNQVKVGADLAATLVNLLAFLDSSTDVQLVKFESRSDGVDTLYLNAATPGTGGNALTLAASVATPSGGTLTGGSGTDISIMMAGRSTSSGAYVADGIDAETPVQAITLCDAQFGQTWYAVTFAATDLTNDENSNCAAYIEASNNKHLYGVSTMQAGVISSVSTTDIAYVLKQFGYKRSPVQYSSSNPYSVCSLLGRILTVNYNGNNTVITLMYKQEPGIVPETLTESQIDALEAKNANVFVKYNNDTAIIEPGKVPSGAFLDEVTGTDWLALTVMTAIYNQLYTTNTKIPQTDAGAHLIQTAIEAVCSQGVANGLLAPGIWNSNGFGILKPGDLLSKGFYVYAPPLASQLQADREARKSVVFQVAAKLAGAVHTVDVIIDVNR